MSENKDHSLRIFTIISQIEQLMESAVKPKLGGGGNRRLVDIGEVFDLLGDLKVTIPEDIRRANSVLLEADTLLEHANDDALDIVDQAQKEADSMRALAVRELEETRRAAEEEFEARVSEDAVLKEVQRRSELLQQHAEHSANVVYDGAKQYADAILKHLQNYLMENYQRVEQNRSELGVMPSPQTSTAAVPPLAAQQQPPLQPAREESALTAPAAPAAPSRRSTHAPQPVEPVAPPVLEEEEFEEQEEEVYAPPKRRRGLFGRAKEDFFDDEDDFLEEDEEDLPPPEPRSRRVSRRRGRELDEDLGE